MHFKLTDKSNIYSSLFLRGRGALFHQIIKIKLHAVSSNSPLINVVPCQQIQNLIKLLYLPNDLDLTVISVQ